MSFAIALSGGGERVVAWEVGVLAGLADGGLDARQAEVVLGTSAGALVASRSNAHPGRRAGGRSPAAAGRRLAGLVARGGRRRPQRRAQGV